MRLSGRSDAAACTPNLCRMRAEVLPCPPPLSRLTCTFARDRARAQGGSAGSNPVGGTKRNGLLFAETQPRARSQLLPTRTASVGRLVEADEGVLSDLLGAPAVLQHRAHCLEHRAVSRAEGPLELVLVPVSSRGVTAVSTHPHFYRDTSGRKRSPSQPDRPARSHAPGSSTAGSTQMTRAQRRLRSSCSQSRP